jgi:hypothetical protein
MSWFSDKKELLDGEFGSTSVTSPLKNAFFNGLEIRICFKLIRSLDGFDIDFKIFDSKQSFNIDFAHLDVDFIHRSDQDFDRALTLTGSWLRNLFRQHNRVGNASSGKFVVKLVQNMIQKEFESMLPILVSRCIEKSLQNICRLDKFVPDGFIERRLAEIRIQDVMDG